MFCFVPANWNGCWILLVSSSIWLQLSKLMFSIFLPPSNSGSLKTKTTLSQSHAGWSGKLDINFKENSMTAHVWTIFMTIAVWTTKKNHQKHSNCKPGKILPSLWLKMPWAWHLQVFFTAAFRTQKLGLYYAPVMNICIFLFFCFHVSVSCSVMSDSLWSRRL